jgi:hypothetical protein
MKKLILLVGFTALFVTSYAQSLQGRIKADNGDGI